ncbi:hypothetical protein HYDPIDRAFT_112438 [Hydnomerulius pinastri MD-312]|uniref:Uncharacterized protein n=1 Tax=Hydnomerulius pinastri MD-312 TaxID=994086 RepID=A0A0C9WEI0_9AGAM|nr:hypothetical protein HYDPIDRAFT_112438 [Hydnomerulius pinastri MD-312]
MAITGGPPGISQCMGRHQFLCAFPQHGPYLGWGLWCGSVVEMSNRYRHAAPSGPWPWMDFDKDFAFVASTSGGVVDSQSTWKEYPQNLFPNWTNNQVERCKMLSACSDSDNCRIFKADFLDDGRFDENADDQVYEVSAVDSDGFWHQLSSPRPGNIRVRALFVDNMSSNVLKMLGTKYMIEPFFFSSSTNWIPSRYREDVKPKEGDHITITLPFIQTVKHRPESSAPNEDEQIIDTQAPLHLRGTDQTLLQDLLAVHMVRNTDSSTIITYHPNLRRSSAERLHALIQRTGRSVYWSKIFDTSKDPTFLLLCFFWYALYAWDEAFENMYKHLNDLESQVLKTNEIELTPELHILQAHLLYYQTLLEDFRKSVIFVQETPNPAMDALPEMDRSHSSDLLRQESNNLLSEIERLEGQRNMQSSRLKNVLDLAFASVNISDSKQMKELTKAAVRDSAAMKQISYLGMIFLPANLIASVFGMNIIEINPQTNENLAHYVEATIILTCLTAWLVIALQSQSTIHGGPIDGPKTTILRRFGWPIFIAYRMFTLCKIALRDRTPITWNDLTRV